jgi:hypothetical protein
VRGQCVWDTQSFVRSCHDSPARTPRDAQVGGHSSECRCRVAFDPARRAGASCARCTAHATHPSGIPHDASAISASVRSKVHDDWANLSASESPEGADPAFSPARPGLSDRSWCRGSLMPREREVSSQRLDRLARAPVMTVADVGDRKAVDGRDRSRASSVGRPDRHG